MFEKVTIKWKLITLSLAAIIAVAIIVGTDSIILINKLSKENVASFEKDSFINKEEELKNYVTLAVETINFFYQKIGVGDNITSELQKEALEAVSKMKYGTEGYFWISDMNPSIIMHTTIPELKGKEVYKIKNANGEFVFKDLIEIANKNNGGMINYMWSDRSGETPKLKSSYVQKFEGWNWIIITGEYVDNIGNKVIEMETKNDEEIKNIIFSVIIFTLISLVILFLIISFFFKKVIVSPLENLDDAIRNLIASDGDTKENIYKANDDEVGKIVDSFNVYLNLLKDNADEDELFIKDVQDVIIKVNNGFYAYRVHRHSHNQGFEALRASINHLIENAFTNLTQINLHLVEYVKANYMLKDDDDEGKNMGGLVASIAKSTILVGHNISEFLCMIHESGDKLNTDTKILTTSAGSLSRSANEQAASLEETATAIEQITSNIKHNTENMHKMSILAHDLNESATAGQDLATKTTQAMEDIDTQVNSINDAITVIDQIAFQTNILSLNAAVEAATAGEAGKGFAVVAQEVRNLASRSAEAAKEIKLIVENATNKANEGKTIANNMIEGYSSLNEKVAQTIGLIEDVSSAGKEQEAGIVQINDAVSVLDRATQINASSATEINRLSKEVQATAETLINIANKATYDENRKNQICDVDLVFQIAKLKQDHIIFKNTNFAKLSEDGVSAWKVTDCNSCNLGKWIIEQEKQGELFAKTSIWASLKEQHQGVHEGVQHYIDASTANKNGDELLLISNTLESSMCQVFDLLDQVKVQNCNLSYSKKEQMQVSTVKKEIAPTRKTNVLESTKEYIPACAVTAKPEVITSKVKDNDEWESF